MSDIDTAVVDSLKVLDLKRPIREADIARAPAFVRYWTKADNGGFWPGMARQRMTHKRHCRAELLHCR